MEEAVSVAAEAGCKAIAWTVRQGAHMLPDNVERDLPKAVELAHKAGLDTPMLITALNEGKSERAEAVLDTMRGVGIRYYRAAPFRYDYSADLAQQMLFENPQHRFLRAARTQTLERSAVAIVQRFVRIVSM